MVVATSGTLVWHGWKAGSAVEGNAVTWWEVIIRSDFRHFPSSQQFGQNQQFTKGMIRSIANDSMTVYVLLIFSFVVSY